MMYSIFQTALQYNKTKVLVYDDLVAAQGFLHKAQNFYQLPLQAALSRQLTLGSVSSAGIVIDREVRSDAASSRHSTNTFPWKLRTAGMYPVSN